MNKGVKNENVQADFQVETNRRNRHIHLRVPKKNRSDDLLINNAGFKATQGGAFLRVPR